MKAKHFVEFLRASMRRLDLPVVSVVAVAIGGTLGVLFERKRLQHGILSVVHAKPKQDVVDGPGSRLSEIMRFGFPGFENVKAKDDYVLSYNRRLRLANWVAEHLAASNVYNRDLDRGQCEFVGDPSVHPLFATTNDDYRRSGYDRGHLAAAANHRSSQDSMCATFFLSNTSPQVGSGFNRDAWEHLEKYSRHLTKLYKNVYVVTGPLFLPKARDEFRKDGCFSSGFENVKAKDDYVLSYNRRLRLANWVAEHLTSSNVYNRDLDRGQCEFVGDPSVHPLFATTNDDYRRSGYDRGHLAAAANHRSSQDSMCATFFLSNMSPQVGSGFNRDAWEHLEKYSRHLTKLYKNVYVVTGPLFLPKLETDNQLYVKYKVIGQNRIAVPTHYFKVILGETKNNQLELQAYILPNRPIDERTPLHKFQVLVETIERASGLIFFDKVPRYAINQIWPTIASSS